MNPRRLAGSRRNKHLHTVPSFNSDWRAANRERSFAAHVELVGMFPHAVVSLMRQAAQYRDPAQRSKPDHAARAVDITAIWPPLTLDDSTAKQRKAAEAGARGKSAAPMSHHRRIEAYFAQRALTGARRLTRRQQRQLIRQEWIAGLAGA